MQHDISDINHPFIFGMVQGSIPVPKAYIVAQSISQAVNFDSSSPAIHIAK